MDAVAKKYPNEDFIRFLNTLHNVSANNQSAITELSITNPFFDKTMVEREVGRHIMNSLEQEEPHVLILTGHAGDGKTGLLFQVLKNWNVITNGEELKLSDTVTMPSGRKCHYIKDFSELSPEKRNECIDTAIADCANGISTFLVANTGPLIMCFEKRLSEKDASKLIDAIDSNDCVINYYNGTPISVINVATIDNTTFVKPYLKKLLSYDLWRECDHCEKQAYCPILNNRGLITDRTIEFITDNYIYQLEYGKKLTIRQIVAHLSYSLTGGLECRNVKNIDKLRFTYLLTNTFFGYKGVKYNKNSTAMKAIGDTYAEAYDQKKLRADETLFIKRDLSDVFTKQISDMLTDEGERTNNSEEWQRAVRRAYMMLNIDTNDAHWEDLLKDVFSTWFPRYLQLRSGESTSGADRDLVRDAMQMLFTDSIAKKDKEIPITMKRENGVSQSVQLVYESKPKKKIGLEQVEVRDYNAKKRYYIYLVFDGNRINTNLSLPLFDFFEEIRKGAIATNIDPMLSQGIDSLKAQIIAHCETEKSEIELIALTDSGWDSIQAEKIGDEWKIYS